MLEAVNEVVQQVKHMRRELGELGQRLDQWQEVADAVQKRKKNCTRRKQYAAQKSRMQEGLLPLVDKPVLTFRDKRLAPKFVQWAQVGMKFAAADQPTQFCTWLVHQWNNCTFLKKPITFSGSSFRIWNGHTRYAYGPRDLMNFSERKSGFPLFRNPAEHSDFVGRPWWDWSWSVFRQVFNEMVERGFDEAPERFQRLCRLMAGGFGFLEVYSDLFWDFNESQENLNKMIKRIGIDFQLMLRAVHTGLRVKGTESPIPIPGEDDPPEPPKN